MYAEILHHQHFCKNFTRLFKGRDDVLEKLRAYVKSEERNQPFVMHGPSGCGKSSILAKCALMVSKKKKSVVSNFFYSRYVQCLEKKLHQ